MSLHGNQENIDGEPHENEETQRYRQMENYEAFGPQPTSSSELPDPHGVALRLVRGIIECVHGLRDPLQFSRWLSEDVYRVVAARSRRQEAAGKLKGRKKTRPEYRLGRAIVSSPRDGVVEASVVVHGKARVRAVAVRLEGMDRRWKATSFSML